jgi:hypothetical protein
MHDEGRLSPAPEQVPQPDAQSVTLTGGPHPQRGAIEVRSRGVLVELAGCEQGVYEALADLGVTHRRAAHGGVLIPRAAVEEVHALLEARGFRLVTP